MAALCGDNLRSTEIFNKMVDEDSLEGFTAYMYSGGNVDDTLSEEPEVSEESSRVVRELLRVKMLSNGKSDVCE